MARMVTDDRARQGPKGRPVLYVLIGSLVLLGLYMVALLAWSGSSPNTNPSQESSRQSVTGGSQGSSTTGSVPTANPTSPTPATPSATPANPKP